MSAPGPSGDEVDVERPAPRPAPTSRARESYSGASAGTKGKEWDAFRGAGRRVTLSGWEESEAPLAADRAPEPASQEVRVRCFCLSESFDRTAVQDLALTLFGSVRILPELVQATLTADEAAALHAPGAWAPGWGSGGHVERSTSPASNAAEGGLAYYEALVAEVAEVEPLPASPPRAVAVPGGGRVGRSPPSHPRNSWGAQSAPAELRPASWGRRSWEEGEARGGADEFSSRKERAEGLSDRLWGTSPSRPSPPSLIEQGGAPRSPRTSEFEGVSLHVENTSLSMVLLESARPTEEAREEISLPALSLPSPEAREESSVLLDAAPGAPAGWTPPPAWSAGQAPSEVYFFEMGAVVLWEVSAATETSVLNALCAEEGACVGPLPPEALEREALRVLFHEGGPQFVQDDLVRLHPQAAADPEARLALSAAIAQSAKLAVLERRARDLGQAIAPLARAMAAHGAAAASESGAMRLLGELFLQRRGLHLAAHVLGAPRALEDARDAPKALHRGLCLYLELPDRVSVLDNRLSLSQELLDMVRVQAHGATVDGLEQVVVWLVALCALIALFQLYGILAWNHSPLL